MTNWLIGMVFVFVLAGPVTSSGAEPPAGSDDPTPRTTLLGGIGNSLGWFGVQGEKYFSQGRASAFLGLGYTPESKDDFGQEYPAPGGVTFAVGGRVFTGGTKHRGFLEFSVSQVAWKSVRTGLSSYEADRFYGPGIQVGYQRIADRGFTLLISAGAGFAIGAESADRVAPILGIGLGHTWR